MKHTVEEITLPNGAKGLFVHVPGAEVVNFSVEFRAGFDLADHTKYELPHVTEHLMFTNKTYPKPRQFAKAVEKNGAWLNAHTNSTSLWYDYECAKFEAERIANLITIQLMEPTFPSKELKTELGSVAEELKGDISSHGRTAYNNLYVAATGVPDLKTRIQQLPSINSDDLRSFYEQTHLSGNMRFVFAGDIDTSPILKALDVGLPKGKRLDLPYVQTKHVAKPLLEKRDIPQIYYSLQSVLRRPISYRQFIAARIISSILANGFSSTLLGKARDKGLVYGLSLGVYNDPREVAMYMSGSVAPANSKKFFKLVNEEISKVLNGKISDKLFNDTKRLMLGQRAISYQTLNGLVGFYENYYTMGLIDFNDYPNYLNQITKEEAVAAFKALFEEKCWGISFVGNIDNKFANELHQSIAPLWAQG